MLCEIAGDAALFLDTPRIRHRTVAWGDSDPVTVDHSSAIVAEQDLLDRLWPRIPESNEPAEWTIVAGGASQMLDFGSRRATVAEVALKDTREKCWIESLESGWLFLIAGSETTGRLIAVGGSPGQLLDRSRLIACEISGVGEASGDFASHPRILSPMFGESWLACGSAAMTLDPVCGDGCGHAVRESILAAAVIRGGAQPSMLEHYQARLRLAFERHLALCRNFYTAGRSGEWWDREIESLDRGLAWSRAHAVREWHHRLDGFDLVPIR